MKTKKNVISSAKLRRAFEESGETQPVFAASLGLAPRTFRKLLEGGAISAYVEIIMKLKKKFKLDSQAIATIVEEVEL